MLGFFGQTGEWRSEHLCLPCERLLWLDAEPGNFSGCGTGARAVVSAHRCWCWLCTEQSRGVGPRPAEAAVEPCAGVAETLAAGFS